MRFRATAATVAVAALVSSTLASVPANAAPTLYEAEDATISQGVVESNHAGFTGTGFVNGDNVAGSYVEFTVAGPVSNVVVRYANGTTATRPMTVGPVTVDFPSTGTWTNWTVVSVPMSLPAGTHSIRLTATTVNGGPNLDHLAIDVASATYEAEGASLGQCVVESNHAGFTGTGFVNCDNVIGSFIEWSVDSADGGAIDLHVRYANGTTAARPATVAVNGTVVATPPFDPTGAWANWASATIAVTLAAGANTVRLTGTTADGPANIDSLTAGGAPPGPGRDWSNEVVRSTMQRHTPTTIGGWSYPVALYLYAQYHVYLRTGDPARLTFIRQWADRFVASDGSMSQSFNNLDSMLGGRVLLLLYKETGQAKYRTAAQKIRTRLNSYPKTSDPRYPPTGGYWHSTSETRVGQLWADGVFMSMPFLAEWGRDAATTQSDRDFSFNTAVNQLLIYAAHLQQPNGLLKHAYDEPRDETWSDNTTGLSQEYWCRAIGWFGMATHMVLDTIPATHPQRGALIDIIREMVRGFETYQDPATGRWFQVVDKGAMADNWTETSCSAMYTYTIDRAIEKGYVSAAQYQDDADQGFAGVLRKMRLGTDNLTYMDTISEGTNVGPYSYYIARAQRTNDFHGLGAFVIMFEQLRR